MNPRSIAVSAEPMLVMANGIQKGFIFLCDCVCSASVAVEKECMPPMALPMRQPARVLSTASSIASPFSNGSFAFCSAFFAATIWYAMNGSTLRAIFLVMNSSGSKPLISAATVVAKSGCISHSEMLVTPLTPSHNDS